MGRLAACIVLFTVLLAACSSPSPTWRSRLAPLVEELEHQDAPRLFPQEYRNLLDTFEHGDAVYHVKSDHQGADAYYQFAFQKAELLRSELLNLKRRLAEAERQLALRQAAQLEEERLIREALAAEERLRQQERKRAEAEAAAKAVTVLQKKAVPKDSPPPLPAIYTVRRGETLPQIAGRTEIYNDSSLWPLIYRANRDQIRDPKRLWPGQVLSIPRHSSHDDVVEARRYSGKK